LAAGRARLGVGAALLTLLGATVGCGAAPVRVSPPSPTGPSRAACEALLADLPATVEGAAARQVVPSDALAAAWGDPPIVLRCGVSRPRALKPTSPCLEVSGVGWFAERAERGTIFTTIGRATYVEVAVPSAYEPPVNPLVDLAAAIKQNIAERRPCA